MYQLAGRLCESCRLEASDVLFGQTCALAYNICSHSLGFQYPGNSDLFFFTSFFKSFFKSFFTSFFTSFFKSFFKTLLYTSFHCILFYNEAYTETVHRTVISDAVSFRKVSY